MQTTQEVLAKTREQLRAEQDQTSKLRKRHLELQGENRDVARHVHEYYTLITDLEKQLSEGRKSQEEWQERYNKLLQRIRDF